MGSQPSPEAEVKLLIDLNERSGDALYKKELQP